MPYTSVIIPKLDVTVSLREAAKSAYPRGPAKTKCNCRGKCDTRRCPCYQQNQECTSHCHPSHSCRRPKNMKFCEEALIQVGPSNWFLDRHMDKANELIKMIDPSISGLQSTILASFNRTKRPNGRYIQILHHEHHWVTISNIRAKDHNTVIVYDSLHLGKISDSLQEKIAHYVNSDTDKLTIQLANVQQQKNSNDCGPLAIACAVSLAYEEDPVALEYTDVRTTIAHAFTRKFFDRFPSQCVFRQSTVIQYEIPLYCKCRGMDNGTSMIECENCLKWCHYSCYKLTEGSNTDGFTCGLC